MGLYQDQKKLVFLIFDMVLKKKQQKAPKLQKLKMNKKNI